MKKYVQQLKKHQKMKLKELLEGIEVLDATADMEIEIPHVSYDSRATLGVIDRDHVGIMGWSQGGRLALLTAARNDVFTTVLTWAGAYDQKGGEQKQYEIAKKDGYYEVIYDWRAPLKQSPAYYECAMAIDYAAEVANIKAPILAINGKEDTTVLPETAQKIVDASTNPDSRVLLLDGADHTFCVFSGDDTVLKTMVQDTIDWFNKTL